MRHRKPICRREQKQPGEKSRESHVASKRIYHEDETECMFPWYFPWVVTMATIAFRIYYVWQPRNWWLLHPDEVYQTLEVAHSEMYGYGFRPNEYLPFESGSTNVTQIRQSELRMGMYSMRSFLLPRFYVTVSCIAHRLGYMGPPFLLWKVSHTLVTSFLPMVVYRFTKSLFSSHAIGSIACIFTASNAYLSVFGTHTLINSFIGTPLFFAIAILLENVVCIRDENLQIQHDDDIGSTTNSRCVVPEYGTNGVSDSNISNLTPTSIDLYYTKLLKGAQCVNHLENHLWCGAGVNTNGIRTQFTRDANMNVIEDTSYKLKKKTDASACLWDFKIAFASCIIVVCCYIRPDAAMFVFVTSLPHINSKCFRLSKIIPGCVGSALGLLICISDDFYSYGLGVLTPLHWLKFNVLQDYSALIYGRMDWMWYARRLIQHQTVFSICSMFSCVIILALSFVSVTSKQRTRIGTSCKIVLSLLLLLFIYSVKGHKELRFLYNVLVLACVVISCCVFMITDYIKSRVSCKSSQCVLLLVISGFILSQWYSFPSKQNGSLKHWTYAGYTESNSGNACLNYVRQQDDVTGVFYDDMIHMSGGYTILHRNVPILALVHFEFYEFGFSTRTKLASVSYIASNYDVHVSTFSQSSEFISMYSMTYLLKHLITNPQYNYIVLGVDKRFLQVGFDEVFREGTKRVLKRNLDANQQNYLQEFASTLPLGTNATVLAYEGEWLLKFNQSSLAKNRLLFAISIDPSFYEAYKLLSLCYYQLGDVQSAQGVLRQCVKRINRKACMSRVKGIQLHDDYTVKSKIINR